jgi:hypothetical protein
MKMKRNLLLITVFLTAFLLAFKSYCQTSILIDPSNDGGFEQPGGFTGNGWTVVNDAVNQWYVGAPGLNAGANGAYISNDGGNTNTFTINQTQVSHFYKDVTFPAGQGIIVLNFDLRVQGEGCCDYLRVHIVPTTTTPAANVMLATGQVGVNYNLQSGWVNIQLQLSPAFAGTTQRLVFTWRNDASVGTQPPASVDNINLYSQASNPLNGVYTIDNTLPTSPTIPVPGNFNSFNDAITYLNLHGVSGPVTFNVTAGQTFTETPKTINPFIGNSSVNPVIFQKNGAGNNPLFIGSNGVSTTLDACFTINGADYITFDGIDVADATSNTTSTTIMEYGFNVKNVSATDGAQNITIQNSTITLKNTFTNTIGILHTTSTTGGGFTPSAISGQNNNCKYYNLTIENCGLGGIFLTSGSTTFTGDNNEVGSIGTGNFVIGADYTNLPNGSIGGGLSLSSFGIQALNQKDLKIFKTTVRNISSIGINRGIWVQGAFGNTEIYNNTVYGIRNPSTTSTSSVRGLDLNLTTLTSSSNSVTVYNNFISDIISNYTPATPSGTRTVFGIICGAGSSTGTYNIDFNSVSVDASLSNASSVCLELLGSTAIQNVRNNILANYTGAQTGSAKHYCIRTASISALGAASSISDYNDFYIANSTNGFVALTSATDRIDIAAWDAAITTPAAPIDVNSLSVDPEFINPARNLHTFSQNINGFGNMLTITWVNDDIDGQTRNAPHDIGADDFTPPPVDIKTVVLVNPVLPPNCYTNCEPVNVRLKNTGLNLIDFTVDPMTVSVNVTGANPQLLNTIVNTGSLAVGDSMLVTVAACYDMSAFGTYNFRPYANITADGNPYNDSLEVISITINSSAGTAAINTNGICFGDSATLTLTGNTGSFQWQSSTDGGVTWVNETGPGNTSSPYIVSPNDTIQYRAVSCSTIFSNILTLNVNSVTNASGTGASRCGYGPVTLNASGTGTIKWHTDSIGGNLVHTGNTYSPLVSQTDTFWIENNLVSGSGNVGKPINFSGSGTIVLNRGMVFNTTTEIVLDSVAVYPIGSGTIQIALRNAANVIIATSAVVPVNGAGLGVYVPLNFTIPIGTGYRLTLNATSGYTDLWFDNTGNTFPYNSAGGEISITNGWTGTATSTAYFYFYDWRFSRVCASPRTPVIVTVTPADSIAVTPNPAFSCQGTPVPLTVNSANSNYNYTWSPSNGLSSTTGANVTANPVSNTTYVVSALDALGCTAYDTVTVTVTPVPVIDATIARDEICGNDTTQLGVTLISGGTNVNQIGFGTTSNTTTSYPAPYGNWFWGARHQMLILASELQAQGFNAGPLNDIAFQVSAPNNCPALVNFEIKMGLTTVNNLTVFQTGLTTVHLNPSYQPVTGWNTHLFSSAFVWDGTSNIIIETCFNNSSFIQNASTFYTATGFQSCIYYFADQAGVCSQTAATSTVNRPNMRFTQYNPVLYSWTPSANVNNPNIANPIGTPVANATTTFYVTVTDSISGCPVVDSVSVNTYPVPQPNLGPNINVCQGQQFVIDAGSTFNTYLWNTGSIGQLIIVNGIATPTTYWVDVTNNYGCTNRDSITVSVNPSPNINLGNDTAICKNHTLTLNAGSGFSSYLWSNGATTPSITIPQGSITSVYYVTVTNAFGCSDTDTILVTVSPCTGIDELDGSQGTVLLYPNPNQGLFNMVIDIPGADNALVEIVNVQGRIVYSTNISNTMAYKDVIDLSANASGIYYVRVISDKYSNISKLMINN